MDEAWPRLSRDSAPSRAPPAPRRPGVGQALLVQPYEWRRCGVPKRSAWPRMGSQHPTGAAAFSRTLEPGARQPIRRAAAAGMPAAGGNRRSVCSRRVSRVAGPPASTTTAGGRAPRQESLGRPRAPGRLAPSAATSAACAPARWSCLGPHTTGAPSRAAPCTTLRPGPVMWRIVHRSCASGRSGTSAARPSPGPPPVAQRPQQRSRTVAPAITLRSWGCRRIR